MWRVPGRRMDGGWHIVAVDRDGIIRRERIVYDEHEEGLMWVGLVQYLDEVDPAGPPAQLRLV